MMRRIGKYSAAGLIGLLLLAAASCGGQHKTPVNGISGGAGVSPVLVSTSYTLQDALAELDAPEKPEGVDTALWNELKGALREALECRALDNRNGSGELQFATSSKVSRPGGRESLSARKLASKPPTGAANKVNDLTATRETNGDFTLSWHYRNLGDYDQNGVVGVSDITPLALHFGEDVPADDLTSRNSIQAVIDGSASGKIGVEDVTQIAQNFGVAVAKYSVRGGDAYAGPFAETTIVGVSPQVGDARKVLTINLGASPLGYWQVVPQDAENAQGEASNIAGIALEIRSVTPTEVKEGTVVTFSADVLGAGPFTYDWDFGGQAVPATSTEASPKVVLTRDTGDFPVRLTITNNMGNTAHPFTLTKLAREWKYEVVLSTDKDSETVQTRSLCEYEGTVYFNVSVLDTGTSVSRYLVSGSSGNWNYQSMDWSANNLAISSAGNLGGMRYTGPFLDWTLNFTEKTSGEWNTEPVQTGLTLGSCDFVYARDDVPFVAYLYREAPGTTEELHYAWRVDAVWQYGIVDDGSSGMVVGEGPIVMRVDADGIPAVAYVVRKYSKNELRLARWDPQNENWGIQVVLDSPPYDLDFHFDQLGRVCFAYGNYGTTKETEAIHYLRQEGELWNDEIVGEWPKDDVYLYSVRLAYDPMGNPLIASYTGNARSRIWWFDGTSWETAAEFLNTYVLTSSPGLSLNLRISAYGTPFVTYCRFENPGDGPKEVILARYE